MKIKSMKNKQTRSGIQMCKLNKVECLQLSCGKFVQFELFWKILC